jgi:hypothetical protein
MLGRDEVGRFARCLGPVVRFDEHDDVFLLALGDTLYSSDSAGYSRNVSRLNQGGATEPTRSPRTPRTRPLSPAA